MTNNSAILIVPAKTRVVTSITQSLKLLAPSRNTNYSKPLARVSILSNLSHNFKSYRVKLAKSLETQTFYAIKIIKRHEVEHINLGAFKKILSNEVRLLQSMNHPNIIKLVEYNCEGEVIIKPSGKAI